MVLIQKEATLEVIGKIGGREWRMNLYAYDYTVCAIEFLTISQISLLSELAYDIGACSQM